MASIFNQTPAMNFMERVLQTAIEGAQKWLREEGIPIGAVLTIDDEIVGREHNQRIQKGSPILHTEMDCLENAGRLSAANYRRAILYTLFRLAICAVEPSCCTRFLLSSWGGKRTFSGPENYLRSRRVAVHILDDPTCIEMMNQLIKDRPDLWNEDIGEANPNAS